MADLKGSVLPNEQFVFSLDSNPTTGYRLVVVSDGGLSYKRWYESDENPEFLDGVGGTEFFAVKAQEPGRYVFVVRYERGPDERGEEFTLDLQVRPHCDSFYAPTWEGFPLTVPLWKESGSDWKIVDPDGTDCRIGTDDEGRCCLFLARGAPEDRWVILSGSEGNLSIELKARPVDSRVVLKARAREIVSHSESANITTGFEWRVVDDGGLLCNDYYRSHPNTGALCGVGGDHTFEMIANSPGTYTLRAVYMRPWEDYADGSLEIVVEAAGQAEPDAFSTGTGQPVEIRLKSDEEHGYGWKVIESDKMSCESEYVPFGKDFGLGERVFRLTSGFIGQHRFVAEYIDPEGKTVDRYTAVIEASPDTECIEGETIVGKPFVIKIPSNPTTGYRWSIAESGNLKVEERYVPDSKIRNLRGGGGKTLYELSADTPGEYTFVANYSRPWENSPIKTLRVKLKVNAAKRIFR